MGLLVDGEWQDAWYATAPNGGRFIRKDSSFRNWVTAGGDAGPTGTGGFKAQARRYHLYVSLACPWAHRTLIMRALKGLEDMISVSVVHWLMLEHGWTFADGPAVIPDAVYQAQFLHQIYTAADPYYTGRVTVPVLWDKHTGGIVNNESSEIIRMLNAAFDGSGAKPGDYYPAALREEIDAINARVYDTVNNGVYKAGFATTQEAYEEAVVPLFDTLDWLEQRLTERRFLLGDVLTEADIRLFTTLIRFDAVYVGHFKCNIRRLIDYPNLSAYTRDIYQWPGIAETVNFEHIRRHYYESHRSINPTGIVPLGPVLDFTAAHGREQLAAANAPRADALRHSG
ncbi:glutathione S-transferase family protein [Bradyrhizobium sp. BR13661]|jgi:putative glutathione S-transferase|uniref:glutathione S-transferase family protein n=1 Tax=Bradyrhizobium sp. BR13661 TaxID=2940622 RepID=UPI002474C3F6|nr:glutathione S-transferase family protein [Bradyrhizobium sp. BR13661]MDH6260241.1 putative glutathione S-transferase [Bradyrhizobium sp. BR13661]